jgi:hypothetical protein
VTAQPGRLDAKILDDHAVSETLRVYGQMSADYRDSFAEQGRRWQADPTLSATRAIQVDAYVALGDEHRAALDDILALTRQIEGHTIEKIMAKATSNSHRGTARPRCARPVGVRYARCRQD